MRRLAEPGRWELVWSPPHPALRPHLRRDHVGYWEASPAPLRRRELPHAGITVIVSLGPAIAIDGVTLTSFAAGLYDRPTLTAFAGEQLGIEVVLTPLGGSRLLGLPAGALARSAVAAGELPVRGWRDLGGRLAALDGWPARFAALDAFLLARLAEAPPPRPDVARAWARLQAARGDVEVGALCRELRCSGRHLARRFAEEVGLGPKAVGRILRFEHAVALLRADPAANLAAVAARAGFCDGSHLTREFRALAGLTPSAYAAASVANVQDTLATAA